MLTAYDIRSRFLEYFKHNQHEIVNSSSLIPRDDPSLLFTNSGMVQFKKVFIGQEKRSYVRATTAQKCLRVGGKHNDLENVGRTARHHTFFEMLGNFSFGDYFKKEAIQLSWKFITEELKLPKDKLYITIYKDDDEAYDLWLSIAGVEASKIYRLGKKDNFWSMGETGPCGPCSEIHIDQGEEFACGTNCGIGTCDCDRFLELWNLVFMQYDQLASGELVNLPKPSIDTGMGLERITAVCQGKHSNYDSDLFQSIIKYMEKLAGVSYGHDSETDTALRVIADHSRAIVFMIADSILPSNEGRGYVLRRLIRRAFRFGKLLGMNEPFLHKNIHSVIAIMGTSYPELIEREPFMSRIVYKEESRFSITLDRGLSILEAEITALSKRNANQIPGDIAFKLYDTYGFPLDIINDVASKNGFTVDESSFEQLMHEQKNRARLQWKGSGEQDISILFQKILEDGLQSTFIGYTELKGTGRIVALLDQDGLHINTLPTNTSGYLITNVTPFYGASGGQTGDTGILRTPTGLAEVMDTLKPSGELTVHVITVKEGTIELDQEVHMDVEQNQRLDSARNHTCTHILQAALKKILGDHVKQAGSLVSPSRLRFDFTHISPLTREEIRAVEDYVNTTIMNNFQLSTEVMEQSKALEKGALALFGEKYGHHVRVVTIGETKTPTSIELCGGTHLQTTGQAGYFIITSESGIASGVRRIEAVTGSKALCFIQKQHEELTSAAAMLKTSPDELTKKITTILSENKTLRKNLEILEAKTASKWSKELLEHIKIINNTNVLTIHLQEMNLKALRDVMDDIKSKLTSGVVCLSAIENTKVHMILYVSPDLHKRFTASALIKNIVHPIEGAGGGRVDQAQAGGTSPKGIPKAFELLEQYILNQQ